MFGVVRKRLVTVGAALAAVSLSAAAYATDLTPTVAPDLGISTDQVFVNFKTSAAPAILAASLAMILIGVAVAVVRSLRGKTGKIVG